MTVGRAGRRSRACRDSLALSSACLPLESSRSAADAVADGAEDAAESSWQVVEQANCCARCECEREYRTGWQSQHQGDACRDNRCGNAAADANPRQAGVNPCDETLVASVWVSLVVAGDCAADQAGRHDHAERLLQQHRDEDAYAHPCAVEDLLEESDGALCRSGLPWRQPTSPPAMPANAKKPCGSSVNPSGDPRSSPNRTTQTPTPTMSDPHGPRLRELTSSTLAGGCDNFRHSVRTVQGDATLRR